MAKQIDWAERMEKARVKALRKFMKDPTLIATEVDAGLDVPGRQARGKRMGFQVFVKVCKWSEEKMKKVPLSGGLGLLLLASPALLATGCVTQKVTVNAKGNAYLTTTAEKPTTVNPNTTATVPLK